MKHLITIMFLAILTGCAKEAPTPPSNPAPPAFDASAIAAQYAPEGITARAPIVFAWGQVQGSASYSLEYQRGIVTIPGSFQYWGTARTSDTTTTVALPSGVLYKARWRVKALSASGEAGTVSEWMYFELQ